MPTNDADKQTALKLKMAPTHFHKASEQSNSYMIAALMVMTEMHLIATVKGITASVSNPKHHLQTFV